MTHINKLRIICLALVMTFLAGSIPSMAAYTDVYDFDSYQDAVLRLGDLGIINGYTDGSFRPSDTLTRAQFAKIAVCALDKEDEAKATTASTNFYDVDQYYWAVPYINYVSKNGIILGYADGTFGTEKPITYAEAVTVLLRALGYTEESVGYFWPNNFMDKAYALGVTSGLNLNAYDYINRASAAVLVDNILFTDINGSKDKPFLANVGYTVLKDNIVVSTAYDDETLKANEIKLSDDSIYECTTSDTFESASIIKYIVINEDNDVVAVKGNLKGNEGAVEMERLGYSVLRDCHIIASSSEDKTLSNGEIRTSAGVYKTDNNSISSLVGECGTLILNKSKKIISANTKEAPYKEYVVSQVNSDGVTYISDNEVKALELGSDFPIYVDYEQKKSFTDAQSDFVAGAELTLYSAYSNDGTSWGFGVIDTNAGYSVINECFIIATKNEDKSLSSDQVKTSNGTYKIKNTDILNKAGVMGTIVVNNSNKIEQFAPTTMSSLSVVANKLTDNTLEYITDSGSKGSFKFDNTFVVYSDYTKSTYNAEKSEISSGAELTFYGETYGNWSFVVINSNNDIVPVLATKNYSTSDTSLEGITINKEGLVIYRNGLLATLGDIQKNDVVYYNTKTNIMDVYNKKVTGIYYEALPSKAYVTSVSIGGNEYEIGDTRATEKLDASGIFDIGERVTLLLGKDNKVIFAVELSDSDVSNYGVVLNTYSEIISTGDNAGKSEIKAKIFTTDGSTYDYVTDKNYKDYKGSLVKLSFDNGTAILSKISSSKTYGTIDKANRTIGGKTVLKDAAIIQLISNEDGKDAEVELLKFDTLDATEISSNKLITSVSANGFGDIMVMYVKDVVLSSYEYGILQSVKVNTKGSNDDKTFSDATYKTTIGSEEKTYISSTNYNITAGLPVAVKASGNNVTDIFNLYKSASATSIGAIDGSRIMINNTIYPLAYDAIFYSVSKDNKYSAISLNEVENGNISSVSIYTEKGTSTNASIKVVVVRFK